MCPKEFKYKHARYFNDARSTDPANTKHIFDIASWSNWIDELVLYANITKPLGKEDSYTLDYIGKKLTGEEKDKYKGSIKTLHFDDYFTFIMYNIQDVILLNDIENSTKHIDLLNNIAQMTKTRPSEALKKTVSIRNFAEGFYFEANKVMSNNHSDTVPNTGKIPGAYVASPLSMSHVGIPDISGKPSNRIFKYATDMDFSSMYPNTIRQRNITPEAEIGTIHYYDPLVNDTEENQNNNFLDHFISNNGLKFSEDYYNLPKAEEIIESILEKESKEI